MRSRSRIAARHAVAGRTAVRPKQAAPVVKWAGGKTKLLAELTSRAPKRFRQYFEPFMGGAALFFRLAPQTAVLTDRNADLVNMYRCVSWNVEAVIRRLAAHKRKHNQEYYYGVRERWNDSELAMADVDRAATFLYMNKTCYNGLWRVNSKGGFNVPAGRYSNPQIYDAGLLRASSRRLQRAELYAGHFADGVEAAEAGDFVYFDPPYHPVNETANFTSYTADSFDADDQHELAAVARALSSRGCSVMISNSDTPFIRKLYKGFRISTVQCARAINSNAARRGSVSELIVTNE